MLILSKIILAYRDIIALIGAITISSIFIFSNTNPQVNALRGWVADCQGRIENHLAWVTHIVSALEENRHLRRRNLQLAMENSQLRAAELENARLKRLLEFRETRPDKFVAASVLGHGSMNFTRSILVNTGTDEGIQKDMPVVTDAGLVGKVIVAGDYSSVIQLLTDLNFSAGARIQRTREVGLITWRSGSLCQLDMVPKSADVQVGDLIVTRGNRSIYPPDIPIGRVTAVSDDDPGLFKRVTVRPAVNLNILEEVFIIIDNNPVEFTLR